MALLNINGVDVATPKTYEVQISDLDGTTNRNAKGDLIRDRIAVKRQIHLEWGPLSTSQISTLLTAVQDVFFTCTYLDPMEGNNQTKTFYVGDRTAPLYNYTTDLWESLKLDFIEK